jgi:5-enolpyruvylshikimate-3-phosphate synthase
LNFIAEKTSNLKGEVVCPGDKSISQRILMIGSLLDQDIEISGFLNALDPLSTLNALSCFGAKIKNDNTKIKIFNKTNFISPKK